MQEEVRSIQEKFRIVGRERELGLALACLKANRNLLIEGAVGVGKTVLATAVASHLGRPIFRVDGDERYSEQKLTGWFDPPVVVKMGYTSDSFIPGPLTQAMQSSGVLFINELNRMPESAQNVLLPCLDENLLIIPKIGQVRADKGFCVVATQNPQEFIATSHLSEALRDRFEMIRLDYQPLEEEMEIVRRSADGLDPVLQEKAVRIARETRRHPAIKRGASVRAALSICQLAMHLDGPKALERAALLALPTRIELKEDCETPIEQVVSEVVEAAETKKA